MSHPSILTRFYSKVGLDTPEKRAWAMFDWANSSFATTVMVAFLPIYFASVAAVDLEPHQRTAYWSFTQSISLLLITIAAPILGAVADLCRSRKKFLTLFIILGVASSCLMYFINSGDWLLASTLFILGNIGFVGSIVFCDSLLPFVCKKSETDKVSTSAYAIGYLGGGILLILNLAWYLYPEVFGIPDQGTAIRLSFVSVGVWWLVFSIPILRKVHESGKQTQKFSLTIIGTSFKSLWQTLKEIKQQKTLLLFLLAFWFYCDGISTVMRMATIYGAEVGIGTKHMIGALLLVQLLGVPTTFLYGAIASRFSAKAGVMFGLLIYTVVCILGYFMTSPLHFWCIAALVACAQGGTQALSRSIYARMVPENKSAEYFSFYSVSSKFAGIFGPLIFGVVSSVMGSSRFSILFLIVFFMIGWIILSQLKFPDAD